MYVWIRLEHIKDLLVELNPTNIYVYAQELLGVHEPLRILSYSACEPIQTHV